MNEKVGFSLRLRCSELVLHILETKMENNAINAFEAEHEHHQNAISQV